MMRMHIFDRLLAVCQREVRLILCVALLLAPTVASDVVAQTSPNSAALPLLAKPIAVELSAAKLKKLPQFLPDAFYDGIASHLLFENIEFVKGVLPNKAYRRQPITDDELAYARGPADSRALEDRLLGGFPKASGDFLVVTLAERGVYVIAAAYLVDRTSKTAPAVRRLYREAVLSEKIDEPFLRNVSIKIGSKIVCHLEPSRPDCAPTKVVATPKNKVTATPKNKTAAAPRNKVTAAPRNKVAATPRNKLPATPDNKVSLLPSHDGPGQLHVSGSEPKKRQNSKTKKSRNSKPRIDDITKGLHAEFKKDKRHPAKSVLSPKTPIKKKNPPKKLSSLKAQRPNPQKLSRGPISENIAAEFRTRAVANALIPAVLHDATLSIHRLSFAPIREYFNNKRDKYFTSDCIRHGNIEYLIEEILERLNDGYYRPHPQDVNAITTPNKKSVTIKYRPTTNQIHHDEAWKFKQHLRACLTPEFKNSVAAGLRAFDANITSHFDQRGHFTRVIRVAKETAASRETRNAREIPNVFQSLMIARILLSHCRANNTCYEMKFWSRAQDVFLIVIVKISHYEGQDITVRSPVPNELAGPMLVNCDTRCKYVRQLR